jgi:hypothetical protein
MPLSPTAVPLAEKLATTTTPLHVQQQHQQHQCGNETDRSYSTQPNPNPEASATFATASGDVHSETVAILALRLVNLDIHGQEVAVSSLCRLNFTHEGADDRLRHHALRLLRGHEVDRARAARGGHTIRCCRWRSFLLLLLR